jgi:hypothetical protein
LIFAADFYVGFYLQHVSVKQITAGYQISSVRSKIGAESGMQHFRLTHPGAAVLSSDYNNLALSIISGD